MKGRRGSSAALAGGALAATVLLMGCGLPLASGVQRPGEVPAEQRLPEPINVLPPGPQPGASPAQVVYGFLAAQSSARDDHRIARSFLAPPQRQSWDDDAGVTVYDPRTTSAAPPQPVADGVVVTLALEVVGEVGADGAARAHSAVPLVQRYRLRQDAAKQWQLVQVPPGLTLSPAGRDRAYDALAVQFLAPPGPPGLPRHLVPDLVRLPVGGDRARELVDRLLAGPSSGLGDSGGTAVPTGTRLLGLTTSAQGEIAVDLSREVAALDGPARQLLSAQLVWTLRQVPVFSRLRLLVQGAPLDVPDVPFPQPRTSWGSFAPDGPNETPPGVALVAGQVRSLDSPQTDRTPLVSSGSVADVAVDSRLDRLAALTEQGVRRTVRVGSVPGPLAPGYSDVGLRSLSWGSGDDGLWLLRTGSRPAVLLLPDPMARRAVQVPVDGLPALGTAALLRVSRDGVRVALVAEGALYVGRVVREGGVPHVVALRRLRSDVRDVAWQTGTSLVVLVADDKPPLLPLVRLSVDGTTSEATALLGVAAGEPVAIAAYEDQPLLVETRLAGRSTVYSGDGGRGFQVRLQDARRPSYPH